MATDPKRPLPAYQQIADQLREQIVSGAIGPGERLPAEQDLAEQFGVSRSTVREALRALATWNLVDTLRGVRGGSFVVNPRTRDISDYLSISLGLLSLNETLVVDDLVEVREQLEVPAAGHAAERRDAAMLEALHGSLPCSDHEVDLGPKFAGNIRFHETVIEAAGNPLLEAITRPVFAVLRERFLRDAAPEPVWSRVRDDHFVIYEAIQRQDREAAEAAMRSHLAHLRDVYRDIARQRSRSR